MQVLCIETSENNVQPSDIVKKGNIYIINLGEKVQLVKHLEV